jgi:hypothetical protein
VRCVQIVTLTEIMSTPFRKLISLISLAWDGIRSPSLDTGSTPNSCGYVGLVVSMLDLNSGDPGSNLGVAHETNA